MDLIKSSLTLQANLFQLFHPIGGVKATPSSHARASLAPKSMPNAVSINIVTRYIAGILIGKFPPQVFYFHRKIRIAPAANSTADAPNAAPTPNALHSAPTSRLE